MISAIDPPGCGCADCLTGYSRPLDCVSAGQVQALLMGELDDRTSTELEVRQAVTVIGGGMKWTWEL